MGKTRNKKALSPIYDICAVKDFWNRNICQTDFLKDYEIGTREFFEESEKLRYRYHYHLLPLFDALARKYHDGSLLEVGCSMGTDLLQLARRDFMVTGIDITEAGIELARKRFSMYGKEADLRVADAEKLPFDDYVFDVAYSFGVLHHTPDPAGAIHQVWRVLKEGGEAVVMLYHRRSLNYCAHRALGIPADGSRSDPVPIAFTYTKNEARKLFSQFSRITISTEYLFGTGWGSINRVIPQFIHRFLGRRIGWHLMIRAVK